MDKRLWSGDVNFLRASGYELSYDRGQGEVLVAPDFVKVARFVLDMPEGSRRTDRYKPHWKLWGYDLI